MADMAPAHLQQQRQDEEEVARCLQGSGCSTSGDEASNSVCEVGGVRRRVPGMKHYYRVFCSD
eukprot:1161316-Pelagomonas_calceolata.AAC.3